MAVSAAHKVASAAAERQAVADLGAQCEAEVAQLWRLVEGEKIEVIKAAMYEALPGIGDKLGAAAATLAADWYDSLREVAGASGKFVAEPAQPKPLAWYEVLARWGIGPLFGEDPDPAAAHARIAAEMRRGISNAHRETIVQSSAIDAKNVGWSRVGVGLNCPFCNMLIGRGFVYKKDTVGFSAHTHCNCIAKPTWDKHKPEASAKAYEASAKAPTPTELRKPISLKRPESAAIKPPEPEVPQLKPRGGIAERVEFPQDALDALHQRGGWSNAKRDGIVAVLKQSEEGKRLLKTLRSFQNGGTAVPRLRTDIESYLRGEDVPAGRRDSIESLLSAIGRSEVDAATLWRGMGIPGDIDSVSARYNIGDRIDMSLASFSTDKKIAVKFTEEGDGKRVRAKQKTRVIVEWVGDDKRALPIEQVSSTYFLSREREWVASGRFSIVGKRRTKRNGVETLVLRIKQNGGW